jgi:hypothetical protein
MLKALALVVLAGCVGQAPPTGPAPVDDPPPAPAPDPGPGSGSAGSGSGSGSAAAPMTATQYLHAKNVAMCTEQFACKAAWPGDPGGRTFEQVYGANAADCATYADAADQPSAVESEITLNHISYSASLAASCIAGTTFPSDCATFWQNGALYAPSCGSALRGLVADGAPCVVDFDCLEGGSYCDLNALVCAPGNKP